MTAYAKTKQLDFEELVTSFLFNYLHKNTKISDSEWLSNMLSDHLPNMSRKDISLFCDEAAGRLGEVNSFLKEMEESKNTFGWNAETWLYHNIMDESLKNKDFLTELERVNAALELLGEWQKGNIFHDENTFFDDDFFVSGHLPNLKLHPHSMQNTNVLCHMDINDLAIRFSRNASVSGVGSISIIGNITIAKKTSQGIRNISQEEIIEALRNKGADMGIKTALTGALKVGAERNLIPVLGRAVSATTLETVAYFAVENSKVVWEFANHEISMMDAVERASRISVSCVFSAKGMAVGAVLGTTIPVVGPIVGGMVGKIIGEAVAREGGTIFYDATTHLAWCAADIALCEWNILEHLGQRVVNPFLRKKHAIREMMPSFLM